ncbi:MAG: hypothetical protein II802_03115, partial [Clostridia bacterium]|nr:hypothetical protein [Clostridia bacterium]
GSHPDVLSVCAQEGKKNISVAQIRELRADAYVKPHMADGKVYIISGADSMNEQAQNAFLKILEEPPAGVVFILLVESKAVLLDTIISRCVSFSLCAPDFEDSVKYIKAQTDIDDAVIKNALEQTSGNIGKALNILSGAGGGVLSNDANEFISFMLEGNCYGMLKVTSGYEKNRVLAEEFFKQIKLLVSEKVRENSGKVYKLKDLIEFYDKLCEYEKSLKTNINLSLLFSAIVCEAERIYS